MYKINRTENFVKWISELDSYIKESILRDLFILREIGPTLGRPYVDSIKDSKYKNLKELRVSVKRKVIRILFIFDPNREILLLIGGDKKNDKQFYKKMILQAEKLYNEYLNNIRESK